MYSKILVPMALDHGVSPQTLKIAQSLRAPGAEIIALHVYDAPTGMAGAYVDENIRDQAMAEARKTLRLKTKDIEGVKSDMVMGHTYRSIVDYAAQNGVDCIVMGSHKPGLSDFLLGSTAARVVRHAPCAVHVFRTP